MHAELLQTSCLQHSWCKSRNSDTWQ